MVAIGADSPHIDFKVNLSSADPGAIKKLSVIVWYVVPTGHTVIRRRASRGCFTPGSILRRETPCCGEMDTDCCN